MAGDPTAPVGSTSIPDLFDISHKSALVTGSTRGLGFEMARILAAAGARVIVHGRSAHTAQSAARSLAEEGNQKIFSCAFDVKDAKATYEALCGLTKDSGTPDILISNAGLQKRGTLAEYDIEDWHTLMDSNLSGAFHVCRMLVPAMQRRGSGKIIFTGSVHSVLPRQTVGAYAASKAGVAMLAKALSCELAGDGIQVNCLSPGFYRTDITQALWQNPEFNTWLRERTPAGRWGRPEDLAGTLLYLCASASDFVTGQNILVDGGLTSSM